MLQRRTHISRAIQLAVIALAATLATLWIGTVAWLTQSELSRSRETLFHSAQLLARGTSAKLEQYFAAAKVLAASPSVFDNAALEEEARRASATLQSGWFLFADATGKVIFNTRADPEATLPKRSDAGVVSQAEACETGVEQLSSIYVEPVSSIPVLSINIPIRNGSGCRVLAIIFPVNVFREFMEGIPSPYLLRELSTLPDGT